MPRFTIAAMLPCSPTSSTMRQRARPAPEHRRQDQERRRRLDHQRPVRQQLGDHVRDVLADLQAEPGDDPLLVQDVVDRGPVFPGLPGFVDVVEPVDDRDLQQQAEHRQRARRRVVGRGQAGRQLLGRLVAPRAQAGEHRVDGEPAAQSASTPSTTISAAIATPPQFSANSMRLCRLVVITNDSTWKSRVRQPIRKQKKQTKQIAEPDRRLLGQRRP